jgi:hypothetical protein
MSQASEAPISRIWSLKPLVTCVVSVARPGSYLAAFQPNGIRDKESGGEHGPDEISITETSVDGGTAL